MQVVTDLLPIRDEPSHHGPDQPVGAIKPNYLTDDHLKVNNQFNNSSLGSQVNHQGS